MHVVLNLEQELNNSQLSNSTYFLPFFHLLPHVTFVFSSRGLVTSPPDICLPRLVASLFMLSRPRHHWCQIFQSKYSRRIQTLIFSKRTKWVIPGLARIARYRVVIHRMLRSRRSFTLISLATARYECFLLLYLLNPICLDRLARSPEREDCVAVPSPVTWPSRDRC